MKQNYEEIIRATDRMLDSGVGITAPFLGYAPQTFPRGKGVLYVGKATRGDFGLESYLAARSSSMSDRVEERKSKARAVFEDYRGSMFWHFAARIGDAVDPKAEQYSNIAWSNLVKIGVPEGNPDLRLHSHTFALNVAALQHEIRELEPAIVVFVSQRYAEEVLMEAIGIHHKAAWTKSEHDQEHEVDDVWWIPRSTTQPAFLWMRHPQGASSVLLDYVVRKVKLLTNNNGDIAAVKP